MGLTALSLIVALAACTSEPAAAPTDPVPTSTAPTTTSTVTSATTSTTIAATTTTNPSFQASIEEVDEVRLAHSWQEGCPVEPEDLSLVVVSHWDFDGEAQRGEIVVNSAEALSIVAVFEVLFDNGYPIESVVPIGDLPEDAEAEPDYANTSGFHCRPVYGGTGWSQHAFGLAIDLNPHLNPLVTDGEIWPADANAYVDRSLGEPGMITDGDFVVDAFASFEWGWGGHWSSMKDFHHFSATGR